MLLKSLTINKSDFETGTGWKIKAEGACKGNICIPIDDTSDDQIDVKRISQRMNLPLVEEAAAQLWALGPDSIGGRTLISAEAPDLRLPDLTGKEFSLASLRGKKVLIYAWAPY
jgi:hypothetical protein